MKFLFPYFKFLPPRERVEFLDMLAESPEVIFEVEEQFRKKLQALERRDPELIKKILEEEKALLAPALKKALEESSAKNNYVGKRKND